MPVDGGPADVTSPKRLSEVAITGRSHEQSGNRWPRGSGGSDRGGQARGATLAQFFLGDPQAWKGPEFAYAGGAAALKAAAEAAGIALYVHAPYVLNVATTNNRIRIPSRKFLQQYCTPRPRSARPG